MRRFATFVALTLVAAGGCKSQGPVFSGSFLDIFTDLDGGPITGKSHSFGTACPGFPVTQEFFIVNTSVPPVTVSSVTLSSTAAFSLVPPVVASGTDIEPNTNVTQVVQFNPTGPGPQPTSTFIVATTNGGPDDAGNPASYTVTLSGNGSSGPAQPTLSTTCGTDTPCTSLLFPQTAVGFPTQLTVTVENQGCPTLDLAVSFTGPDGGTSPFSVLGAVPAVVNFNNPVTLTVQYAPTVPNHADFWNLVLTTNDGNVAGTVTPIQLTGLSADLKIAFTPACLPPPGGITIGDGGQVNVGSTVVIPYTVTNRGSLPLDVGVPYIADGGVGYSVTNAWSAPIPLDAGDSASFDVSFTSPGKGTWVGTVEIPVLGGTASACQMFANSEGRICSPDGGPPQQLLVLDPPDPSMQLCGATKGSVTLTNCGSAPIDFCGVDAGTDGGATFYGIDAGVFGQVDPGGSFVVDVSFTDPATLKSPWIQTFNVCNDAPGYGIDDAGGGGYQLTVQATTILVPQENPPQPPVVISGLDDGGVNPVFGQEMHLLADIDAGLGNVYYNWVWTTPPVASQNVNVCADGGMGIWYVDGGVHPLPDGGIPTLPDGGPIPNNGGEAFVTPVKYWVLGDTHPNFCKICAFYYEADLPNGSCGFDAGFSPTAFHCFGGASGIAVTNGP